MAVVVRDYSGVGNGVTVTAALVGCTAVTNTSGSYVGDTGVLINGKTSGKVTSAASGANYISDTIAATTGIAFDVLFQFDGTMTTLDHPIVFGGIGATRSFQINVNSAGKLRLLDSAGATVATFAVALTGSGTLYRVAGYITSGAGTGTYTIAYYAGLASTTPVETALSGSGAQFGATGFTQVRSGKVSTASYVGVLHYGDFRYDPAATGLIPIASGTAGNLLAAPAVMSLATPAPSFSAGSSVSGGGPATIDISAPAATMTGAIAISVPVSGSGSVGVSNGQGQAQNVGVFGSGSVSTSSQTSMSTAVSVPGSGAVTVAAGSNVSQTVSVLGSGSVSTTRTENQSQSVGVAGSGSVSTSFVPGQSQSVGVAGSGSVSVVPGGAASQSVGVGGSGSVSTTPVPSQSIAVTVGGVGSVSLVSREGQSQSVTIVGTGYVLAGPVINKSQSVSLAGAGFVMVIASTAPPSDIRSVRAGIGSRGGAYLGSRGTVSQ